MAHSSARLKRSGRWSALLLALPLALAGSASPAYGDTQPPSGPATVSTDPLDTVQVNGVVWTQVIVGNTVYAGGSFTNARPAGAAPGVSTVPRSNFLAYDLTTGTLLPFAPTFNAPILALAVSPDQKILYVGGQFTQVNGVQPLPAGGLRPHEITGRGADFVHGDDGRQRLRAGRATRDRAAVRRRRLLQGQQHPRTNAVAVDGRTGAVQPFAVTPAGGVIRQVAVSPDRTKVVLGGTFKHERLVTSGYGLAMVDADTRRQAAPPGQLADPQRRHNATITSLVAAADGFYGTGQAFGRTDGNFEGAFKADWNGNRIWIEDCHGDTYWAAVDGKPSTWPGTPTTALGSVAFPTPEPRGPAPRAGVHHGADPHPQPGNGRLLRLRRPAGAVAAALVPEFTVGTYTGQSQGPWHVAVGAELCRLRR